MGAALVHNSWEYLFNVLHDQEEDAQNPARPVVFARASRGLDHELGNDLLHDGTNISKLESTFHEVPNLYKRCAEYAKISKKLVKMTLEGAKGHQKAPQRRQGRAKRTQMEATWGPKRPKVVQKGSQGTPKDPPGPPKGTKMAPKWHPGGAKGGQGNPKRDLGPLFFLQSVKKLINTMVFTRFKGPK
jgi:hypothetical protein